MRSSRHLLAAALIGGSLLGSSVLGACSTKTSPEEFKKELVKAGLPETMATCIETEMKSQNIEISNYTGMSADETAKFEALSTKCAAKEFEGITGSIPNITVPDISIPS